LYDRTPLHIAAANGRDEIVKYLLEKGADATAVDENGERPVEAAIQMGHTGTAKILKDALGESADAPPPAEGQ
jgi:ankyrin repeat protein